MEEIKYQAKLKRKFWSQQGVFFSRIPGSDSGDIIQQTRTQMDSHKNTLMFLARKPEAAPILEKVFAERNKTWLVFSVKLQFQ